MDFEGILRKYIGNPMDFLDFHDFHGFLKLPPIPLGKHISQSTVFLVIHYLRFCMVSIGNLCALLEHSSCKWLIGRVRSSCNSARNVGKVLPAFAGSVFAVVGR